MVSILPFVGTRYNNQLIQDLKLVLAPPYDVITKDEQKDLYQRHQNNAVRLVLGVSKPTDDEYNNKYTRSANYIQSWKRDGVFVDDDKKSLYIYEQSFTTPEGVKKTRLGFFALIKLEDYKSGNIIPHEQTEQCPGKDQLKLMRATKSNLSPIFLLHADPGKSIENMLKEKTKGKSWMEIEDLTGGNHRLWVVNKKDYLNKAIKMFEDKKVFIADGHHTYETALLYQREMREATGQTDGNQPFDYIVAFFAGSESEGVATLPSHRVLSNELASNVDINEIMGDLKENFTVHPIEIDINNLKASAQKMIKLLQEKGKANPSFIMAFPKGKGFLLTLKPGVSVVDLVEKELPDEVKKLDVSILHYYIIAQVWIGNPEYEIEEDEIKYFGDAEKTLAMLQNKKGCVAFLANPIGVSQAQDIAARGFLLPRNSTNFYPKLTTGLIIRDMTNKW